MTPQPTQEDPETFLFRLEKIIADRKENRTENSYTSSLFNGGLDKILQKVGEESVEYILEAKNNNRERMASEGADLIFHFLVSLQAREMSLTDIIIELQSRHQQQQ